MSKTKISVIIPVKNGIATIRHCLDAIFNQTLISQTEVIVIDSGSTDGTLDVLKEYPVRLYQIPPETFNHGATRNYGVSLAKGEFVVMTVQDAVAASNEWLQTMYSHFNNHEVVGVCGQQFVPSHKDKNPFEWHRPVSKPQASYHQFKSIESFNRLLPIKQREICGWDDVNAMYRKKNLIEHPFRTIKFGEDLIWAKEMITSGHVLVYEPNAKVKHYHTVSYNDSVIRKEIEMLNDYVYFDIKKTRINIPSTLIFNAYRLIKWKIPLKWYFYQLKKEIAYNKAVKNTSKIINRCTIEEIKLKYF